MNFQKNQIPVVLKDGQSSPSKRNASQMDFTLSEKKTKFQSAVVNFSYEDSFDNKFTKLSDIASLSLYDTVDVKVKVIQKTEERQKIIVRGSTCFKAECLISDGTDSIRLELWESAIDKISRGECYHIQNVRVRIFNDIKYLNTNEFTTIDEIKDTDVTELESITTALLKDSVIEGEIIGVDMQRTLSCPICHTNREEQASSEMIDCTGCKNTILKKMLKPKVVSKLALQIDSKITTYSAFNDALESFLFVKGNARKLPDMREDEIKLVLLTAGKQKLIVDKSTKIVTQFLS